MYNLFIWNETVDGYEFVGRFSLRECNAFVTKWTGEIFEIIGW